MTNKEFFLTMHISHHTLQMTSKCGCCCYPKLHKLPSKLQCPLSIYHFVIPPVLPQWCARHIFLCWDILLHLLGIFMFLHHGVLYLLGIDLDDLCLEPLTFQFFASFNRFIANYQLTRGCRVSIFLALNTWSIYIYIWSIYMLPMGLYLLNLTVDVTST